MEVPKLEVPAIYKAFWAVFSGICPKHMAKHMEGRVPLLWVIKTFIALRKKNAGFNHQVMCHCLPMIIGIEVTAEWLFNLG